MRGTVRALLRRVAESDTLPVTLREVSEGGVCVALPGAPPETGARVTVEMALWRQMLYLPANVVWSRTWLGTATCGLKLHLEVTDSATRRAFAGWVRNQAMPDRAVGVAAHRPQQIPAAERPYELDLTEMETEVTGIDGSEAKSRGQELFEWLFRGKT